MPDIENRLTELGIELPAPLEAPPGATFLFERVRLDGDLAYLSGHGPVDGAETIIAGKVGAAVSAEEAASAARMTGLSLLASLRAELGSLDRVEGFISAFGMVNCAAGFNSTPAVINGFSSLILEIWGPAGAHARSAIGVAELPFDWPVEIEAVAKLAALA